MNIIVGGKGELSSGSCFILIFAGNRRRWFLERIIAQHLHSAIGIKTHVEVPSSASPSRPEMKSRPYMSVIAEYMNCVLGKKNAPTVGCIYQIYLAGRK